MHPAPSIIAFTVLSGLGFGLLAFLCLGLPPVTGWVALVFYALAYALAVGGLMASAFHLGNPQRALRAFTQWRTSWLSREAVLSVATLSVAGVHAAGLIFFGVRLPVMGALAAGLCVATVLSTSMIYAQLRTVPRWNHASTPLLFLALSLGGGALLAAQGHAAAILIAAAGALQLWAWAAGDGRFRAIGQDAGTATGLGGLGSVRQMAPPHTGRNYLLDEMVFRIGRKHALRLRALAILLMAVVPVTILLVLPYGHATAPFAVLFHLVGVLAARWLFFAEAEHVVGLYYGLR